jgi:hypothetical protein
LSKWPWIGYPAFLRQTHIILSPRWLTELVERNWCIKNWTCVGKSMLKTCKNKDFHGMFLKSTH